MKEKYVEERFPRYFIFGDLSDVNGSLDDERLISQREDVVNMVIRLAKALDEIDSRVFKSIWYGDL